MRSAGLTALGERKQKGVESGTRAVDYAYRILFRELFIKFDVFGRFCDLQFSGGA
jgi:hypothetical protein